MFDISPMLNQPFGVIASVKNASKPQWMEDFDNDKFGKSKPSKKETAFGSWSDFEKETGMTKEQYLKREKKINEKLAEIEVAGSIYRGGAR